MGGSIIKRMVSTPLKNMNVSWDHEILNIWKVIIQHVPNHPDNEKKNHPQNSAICGL
jgi:transposase-like protein